jgi:undecaprenyl-diphosphatase
MSQAVSDFRYLTNAVASSLLFLGTVLLVLHPDWFDRPLAKAINNLATDQPVASRVAAGIAYPTVEGVIVVSLIWCCWFSGIDQQLRARIISGACAAVFAGLIAHLLKSELPAPPKPIFDPALRFHVAKVLGDIDVLRATSFPDNPSFPSERGSMFAGLAITILLVRYDIGLLALGCTLAASLSRVYLGLHYPTSILGSFALAACIVWLAQTRPALELSLFLVKWERASAPTFYMFAFLVSYQLVTTFQDLRDLAALFLR